MYKIDIYALRRARAITWLGDRYILARQSRRRVAL